MSSADDQIAAGHEVIIADQIRSGADFRKVFMRFTCDAEDVRSLLLDLTERFRRARDCLVYDDGLHIRVISEVDDGLNRCLKLFRKVIRIDGQRHAVLTVHLLKCFGASSVILRLGYGTRDDTNVVITVHNRFCRT